MITFLELFFKIKRLISIKEGLRELVREKRRPFAINLTKERFSCSKIENTFLIFFSILQSKVKQ